MPILRRHWEVSTAHGSEQGIIRNSRLDPSRFSKRPAPEYRTPEAQTGVKTPAAPTLLPAHA